MSERIKLPVFETIGEAFGFAFRKILPVLILNITTAIVILLPIGLLMLLFIWTPMQNIMSDPPVEPEQSSEFFLVFVPFMLLVLLIVFLFYSVLIQRITNNVINGQSVWLFRINKNTLQVFGGLISYLAITVMIMFITIFVIELGAETLATNFEDNTKGAIQAATTILAIFAAIYLIIRVSLIPTAIAAEGKFSLSDGIGATKGNVTRLFFLFLFITASTLAISLIVQWGLMQLLSIDSILSAATPTTSATQDSEIYLSILKDMYSSTGFLVYWALLMLVQSFQIGLGLGSSAIAYGKLTGKLPIESHTEHLGSVELG